MPTEEVFTTPHRARTEGTVATTMPFLLDGTVVEGLKLTFAGGRIVEVEADRNVEVVRNQISRDEGAAMLGEVALVDVASPINRTGVLFHNTLFDENAACHMAWGAGIAWAIPGLPSDKDKYAEFGFNHSSVHTDVMVGSDQLDVEGVTKDGRRVQILKAGEWVLAA
jgi:aminopeptidase